MLTTLTISTILTICWPGSFNHHVENFPWRLWDVIKRSHQVHQGGSVWDKHTTSQSGLESDYKRDRNLCHVIVLNQPFSINLELNLRRFCIAKKATCSIFRDLDLWIWSCWLCGEICALCWFLQNELLLACSQLPWKDKLYECFVGFTDSIMHIVTTLSTSTLAPPWPPPRPTNPCPCPDRLKGSQAVGQSEERCTRQWELPAFQIKNEVTFSI